MYRGGGLPPKSMYSIYTAQGAQCNTSTTLYASYFPTECHKLEWVADKIIFSLCIVWWHSKVSRLFGHNIMHVIRRWSRKEFCALKLNEPLMLGTHTKSMIVHIIEGERRVASIRYAIVNMIFFLLNGIGFWEMWMQNKWGCNRKS